MTETQAAPEMVFDGASKVVLDALTLAAPAAAKSSVLFVVQGVHMEAAGGRLRLRTTNLAATITVSIPAITVTAGAAVPHLRQLADFLRAIGKDGALRLSTTGSKAAIVVDGAKARIDCYPVDEFPTEPALGERLVELPADLLTTGLSLALPAAAQNDARLTLCAICVELGPEGVTLAAADGYRLHVVRLAGARAGVAPRKLLLARENVPALLRLLDPAGDPVALHLAGTGGGQLAFVQGDRTFTSLLVEGAFPNYHPLIPDSCARTLAAPAGEWHRAIGVASVYCDKEHCWLFLTGPASESAGPVALGLATKLDITSACALAVEASAGEAVAACLNYRYCAEAVAALPGGAEVELGWNGAASPARFRASLEGIEYLSVVMPMHARDGGGA